MFILSDIDTVLSYQHLSSQYAASAQASCLSLFILSVSACKLDNKPTYVHTVFQNAAVLGLCEGLFYMRSMPPRTLVIRQIKVRMGELFCKLSSKHYLSRNQIHVLKL
jgi:hypothetical protein